MFPQWVGTRTVSLDAIFPTENAGFKFSTCLSILPRKHVAANGCGGKAFPGLILAPTALPLAGFEFICRGFQTPTQSPSDSSEGANGTTQHQLAR